jgi:FkbM family methyltransferase
LLRRYLFETTVRWQLVRRQIRRIEWADCHLPWRLWCALCAWNAAAVAEAIGRRSRRSLRFVQIGSNDGVLNDPLHAVVRTHRWTGVLVEPIPAIFDELVANYADVPGLAFENVAVGSGEGKATIFTLDPRPDDPDWAAQLSSFDREVLLSHREALADLEERILEVPIEAVTVPALVRRHRIESLDLLHVDAEGHDYEVLHQIDFAAPWAPRFVIFEKKHMGREAYLATKGLLRRAGYRCVNVWPDELAYRESPHRL